METELHVYPSEAEVMHFGNPDTDKPTSASGRIPIAEAEELCDTLRHLGTTITTINHTA